MSDSMNRRIVINNPIPHDSSIYKAHHEVRNGLIEGNRISFIATEEASNMQCSHVLVDTETYNEFRMRVYVCKHCNFEIGVNDKNTPDPQFYPGDMIGRSVIVNVVVDEPT